MRDNTLGIEEVRAQLGDLVDDAHEDGVITRITRRGRHIASIVPAGSRSSGLPDAAVEAAVDAAWPGLPENITMGQARRRVIAALNAAYPYLAAEEPDVLPDIDRLQKASDHVRQQIETGSLSPSERARSQEAVNQITEAIRETRDNLTQYEVLQRVIDADSGTWDADRAVAALRDAGHEVDHRRARALLRRLANKGRLTRTNMTRAIYEATEQ